MPRLQLAINACGSRRRLSAPQRGAATSSATTATNIRITMTTSVDIKTLLEPQRGARLTVLSHPNVAHPVDTGHPRVNGASPCLGRQAVRPWASDGSLPDASEAKTRCASTYPFAR